MFFGELGQLHTDAIEVQAGDFFVQFLGQTIDADLVGGAIGPEIQLRDWGARASRVLKPASRRLASSN